VVRGRWSVVRRLLPSLASVAIAVGGAAQTRVVDDFASLAGWHAAPSEGVTLAIAGEATPSGRAMRLDFDFHGYGGWAAARRAVDLALPANYEFTFRVRGDAPSENLEFKLVDASGENVWWSVQRDVSFPREWQTVRIRKRQVSFAWGPSGGGELRRAAAIEFAITAGSGGRGSLWIADLDFTPLPPDHPYTGTPVVTASSSSPAREPARVLTGERGGWHSDPRQGGDQWLQIDFGERREFGGLVIDWGVAPGAFQVELSEGAPPWSVAWRVDRVQGGRSYVPLTEADARLVRLTLREVPADGVGITRIEVEPLAFAATPNDFIASVASDGRRGLYPRGFLGEMSSWTLVGSREPRRPAGLLGADGAFEPAPRTFSLEPFVWLDGTLVTWTDVTAQQALAGGDLPVPTVRWTHAAFALEVTAVALDDGNGAALRYRLTNRTDREIAPRLYVAIRPFQVNPPSQFLNTPGGVGAIESITPDGRSIVIGGMRLAPSAADCAFGATAFDAGDVVAYLDKGLLPTGAQVADRGGRASGAFARDLDVEPGGSRDLWVEVGEPPPTRPSDGEIARRGSEALGLASASWRTSLDRVGISGPPELTEFVRTARSNLAYILESRDGPALRPGTRSYARSWIRDGTMMAAALLRFGHGQEVGDYLRWYAPYQFASGKVPCCVDRRGADPVAENDANGEFLFLAAEYLRFTGDRATVAGVWPRIVAAVRYLDGLRAESRTGAFRTAERLALFGLLPESISHEGYSAKPMHSYWDDFWALAGLDGAAWVAAQLGHGGEAAAWGAIRDEFRSDVLASIARVREAKRLAYVPGCAELGDFDPTSTTVALWPADSALPRDAVDATFERYWREAEARFNGNTAWESYTPYEWRNVGAFVRLGWRERALHLARWLMADRMPVGWNQWPEIVWRDRTTARFLGDLPHAWVGSDFIRAFLDMLAFDRASDQALVIGAGLPPEWLAGDGLAVHGLQTPNGTLSFTMRRDGEAVRIRIERGISVPPGGIVVRPPLPASACVASVDGGRPVRMAEELAVRELPADVRITPGTEE